MRAIAALLIASLYLVACDRPRAPEVHKVGTVCFTEGMSAIDPDGHDILCKKNDLDLKRWVRVN